MHRATCTPPLCICTAGSMAHLAACSSSCLCYIAHAHIGFCSLRGTAPALARCRRAYKSLAQHVQALDIETKVRMGRPGSHTPNALHSQQLCLPNTLTPSMKYHAQHARVPDCIAKLVCLLCSVNTTSVLRGFPCMLPFLPCIFTPQHLTDLVSDVEDALITPEVIAHELGYMSATAAFVWLVGRSIQASRIKVMRPMHGC